MTAPSLPTTAPACNPMDPNHAPWRRAVGSAHQNASVNQNPGSDSQRRVGGGELRLVDRLSLTACFQTNSGGQYALNTHLTGLPRKAPVSSCGCKSLLPNDLPKSGRQDLNLRPLDPQSGPRHHNATVSHGHNSNCDQAIKSQFVR